MSAPKPLRIMFLMDYYVGARGGTERQIYELVENIDRRRFTPYFTVFRSDHVDRGLDKMSLPPEVKVLDIHHLQKATTIIRLLHLSRFIKANRIDLVHIFFNDAAISAPLFCKLGGAQVISSRRDMGSWYNSSKLAALRVSNLFVDKIITNCEAVKNNVCRQEHFAEDNIKIIVNGHNHAKFLQPAISQFREKWEIGKNDPLIGIVANISPLKRHIDMLAALKIIHQKLPDTCLVLVGGGGDDSVAEVMNVALRMRIADRVRFIGNVADPVPIIKHLDVCALCSQSEGLSNAIIEYMGCGKPTVCSDVGGNPELILHGHNGFLYPVGDVNKLASYILQIIGDPLLKDKLGACAREEFLKEAFSITSMVDNHMTIYTELMK